MRGNFSLLTLNLNAMSAKRRFRHTFRKKVILNLNNFGQQGRSCSARSYNALNTHHSGIPEQQRQQQQHCSNNKINNNNNNNKNIVIIIITSKVFHETSVYAHHSLINLGQTSAVFRSCRIYFFLCITQSSACSVLLVIWPGFSLKKKKLHSKKKIITLTGKF